MLIPYLHVHTITWGNEALTPGTEVATKSSLGKGAIGLTALLSEAAEAAAAVAVQRWGCFLYEHKQRISE